MGRQWKEGDTIQRKFRLTGVKSTGAGFSGSTAYLIVEDKFGNHSRLIDRGKMSFEASTALSSSTSYGVVTYTPGTSEVTPPGEYRYEIEVTFNDGSIGHFPSDGYDWIQITPATT